MALAEADRAATIEKHQPCFPAIHRLVSRGKVHDPGMHQLAVQRERAVVAEHIEVDRALCAARGPEHLQLVVVAGTDPLSGKAHGEHRLVGPGAAERGEPELLIPGGGPCETFARICSEAARISSAVPPSHLVTRASIPVSSPSWACDLSPS